MTRTLTFACIWGAGLLVVVGCGGGGSDVRDAAVARDAAPPDATLAAETARAVDAPAPDAGCPEPLVICDSTRPLPPTIAETGFFPAAPDLERLPAALHPYQPDWPLWSDGLDKSRAVLLPPGQTVDNRGAVWEFPAGTLFIKTFLSEGRRPVETRVLRRVDDPDPFNQWQYAVYRWNDGGTDATLLSLDERLPVPAVVGGQTFIHQIPSREDCGKCHAANRSQVIGFDELRLAWTTPGARQSELDRLAPLLAAPPPTQPAAVVDPDPGLRAIKGYLFGNCLHCHDGRNSNVFDLHPADFPASVLCQRTNSPGTLEGWRVRPGKPDESILYLQLARRARPGINPMPPVGVERPDLDAVAAVRRWIAALPATPCPE